ncbi:thiamine pyrophosphate-binding protein [Actinoplanes oblitus]|uniref:Thiamine pyrophosphate-binding protein n=1 Tax=Actinoplanes oblitus TaxID=3040509 RepID=A0ABY8W4P0_9ACTN|nr:thiamine pyrophosphate-binding protein [Actinoplanes oblitus]WIM92826.1 thiamine pyrophosphate-binding protein [Actinoplanes oblitus]
MGTASRPGRQAVVEQLVADGHRYLFGNPGTVEEGLLDALQETADLEYVFALHEAAALGMADGYARATRRPAIVQLHSGVGLGNGIGMMYQAMRGHSPLVVLAGDAGLRYEALDAQMAADLVAMARPVTKWATRVTHPDSLLRVLRRACKVAATPPYGPVFVALPMDVLDAANSERVVPTTIPQSAVTPPHHTVRRIAAALAGARRPLIIAGDGVTASGAQTVLGEVAELVGAPVYGGDWSEVNLDHRHPCFRGQFGHMFGTASLPVTNAADVVLICGTSVLPEVFPEVGEIFDEQATVVHVDLNAWEIGKNHRVDVPVLADPAATLHQVREELRHHMTPARAELAWQRRAEFAGQPAGTPPDRPVLDTFLRTLRDRAEDLVVFDEAITASPHLLHHLRPGGPDSYFLTRGGSLGVGLPGAVGLKLARPEATVVGFAGDGGSMYTFQALWTAARHRIPAKFVICDNGNYQILRDNIAVYWSQEGLPAREAPDSFRLDDPHIDFVSLARGLGVAACDADAPASAVDAVEKALGHDGPFLVRLDTR